MAAGVLGKANLSATTYTKLYGVPTSAVAEEVEIRMFNRNTSPVTVRLAIATSLTPSDDEWLEYDTEIKAKGSVINYDQIAQGDKLIVAYASTTGVTVTVQGIERPANA
jgi:hypothetical protein